MADGVTNWELAEDLLTKLQESRRQRITVASRLLSRAVSFFRADSFAWNLKAEDQALGLQIRVAQCFIDLRREARTEKLPLPVWLQESLEIELLRVEPHSASSRALKLLERIQSADIPANAKQDILADYWNKWAFVIWERALLEENSKSRTKWLGYVARCVDLIRQDHERKSWTPLQMTELRLLLARSVTGERQAEGDQVSEDVKTEAQQILNRILGVAPVAPAPSAETDPSLVDAASMAHIIHRMSEVPDPIAIGSNLRRIFPNASQETLRGVTEMLAGAIKPDLLDQILRQYSGCT